MFFFIRKNIASPYCRYIWIKFELICLWRCEAHGVLFINLLSTLCLRWQNNINQTYLAALSPFIYNVPHMRCIFVQQSNYILLKNNKNSRDSEDCEQYKIRHCTICLFIHKFKWTVARRGLINTMRLASEVSIKTAEMFERENENLYIANISINHFSINQMSLNWTIKCEI